MAEMYPRTLKTESELEKQGISISSAERKLFDVFRKHLPGDYTVFHGVLLQSPRKGGGIWDREIDFLVAHPEHGLLTLEVKGGLVRVDGTTGEWTSKDRHGQVHSIKDPFLQIKQACYDLNALLRNHKALAEYDFSTWYGVALPDVDVDGSLGPGAPRATILDRKDCNGANITAAIERMFKHYRKAGQKPLGAKGMKALTRKLVPSHFLKTHLATEFAEEEDRFVELTVQQFTVLEFLADHNRALIAGCAGSGKTLLAAEKARQLSADGKRVLFTCYNKSLAEWLTVTYDYENVTFQHFHSLASSVAKEAGKPIPWMTDLGLSASEYWGEYVPTAMFDAAAELKDKDKYDAIIVDEGQDFLGTYWEPIQMLLKEPDDGTLYIFYDDSQRLYSDDNFPLPKPAGRLNKNLRSTYEIGEQVTKYYEGVGQIHPGGPRSERPLKRIKLKKDQSPAEALEDVLGMLADEKVKPRDIVILTPNGENRSALKHKMQVGDFELARSGKIKGNRIEVSTIHGFKGLERQVVILCELDTIKDDGRNTILYVGLSRARNYLVVIGELPGPA